MHCFHSRMSDAGDGATRRLSSPRRCRAVSAVRLFKGMVRQHPGIQQLGNWWKLFIKDLRVYGNGTTIFFVMLHT